jgi:energy-coupling factor transporter ATP-binding protein EcfA2
MLMPKHSFGCVGRDAVCADVTAAAHRTGSVLLFGGRQAGKTTLLRHIAATVPNETVNVTSLAPFDAIVYLDLMTLPYDAQPTHFFEYLTRCAASICQTAIGGFKSPSLRLGLNSTLDTLVNSLQRLVDAAGNVDLRFLFLLDESKRVLGARFPRGFQDNLFALLYGELDVSYRCSLVFAGGQELYGFCEDETSPIGSRAAKVLLTCLSADAVREMVTASLDSATQEECRVTATEVFHWTGGHAGLTAQLCRAIAASGGERVEQCAKVIATQHSELFTIWRERLSTEARAVHDHLVRAESLSRSEIAHVLARKGLDSLRSDRARNEIEFTGIGTYVDGQLRMANRLYREMVLETVEAEKGTPSEENVWALIRETELAGRRLIIERYTNRWGTAADGRMQDALGREAWDRIIKNRGDHKYRAGREPADEQAILDFAYLGQLGQLMLWGPAWDMFRHLFRDKRDLEDLLKGISPVRNDMAHFRNVPDKELARCRVASDDLLAVLERELRNAPGDDKS